jgi:glucose-6-phosphate isomerase
MATMKFDPGINIQPVSDPLGFNYGNGVFGPVVELRRLDDIRISLLDPSCEGPDVVYAIAMDVGKIEHIQKLQKLNLLFGVVTYSSGKLGNEPIRSQGHIHKVSPTSNWSTPEIYEIWTGKAIVYMQESASNDPGRCFAVVANPGDVVIVPPFWAHATISADSNQPLTFGAWCIRNYGFEYKDVRAHNGLAWFPVLDEERGIHWKKNNKYNSSKLQIKGPEDYHSFGIEKEKPIYRQFEEDESRFLFVPNPIIKESDWINFIP